MIAAQGTFLYQELSKDLSIFGSYFDQILMKKVFLVTLIIFLIGLGHSAGQTRARAESDEKGSSHGGSTKGSGPDTRAIKLAAADDGADASPDAARLSELESLEQQCLDEINRLRHANGLGKLEMEGSLLAVARQYSRRMGEENFFSHADPQGRTVRDRVNAANVKWRTLGENLAYSSGYFNPVAASLHGWMGSPPHRKNILEPAFNHTVVGAWISSNGTVYFTEIFLRQ